MVSGRKRLHHASYFFTPAGRLVMISYGTYICNMNARVCTHKARQTQGKYTWWREVEGEDSKTRRERGTQFIQLR